MQYRYESDPFPHLFIEQIIDPTAYDGLNFPDDLVRPGADWGITGSDPEYSGVLEDPGWRRLHHRLTGAAFVSEILGVFAADLRREGCLVDPDRAHLVDFTETREQKEAGVLTEDADPNSVYTRLDFQSRAEGGYREFVHLDWGRRIVGGILFFSDADEEGLEGGELALYRDRAFQNDRWCHDPELVREFRPRHNTGVIFLNSNVGFHGPRGIRKLAGRRRWLYFTISSQRDVWPHADRLAEAPN